MRFIALTRRNDKKGHVTVDSDCIVAMEDHRFSTPVEAFHWTNVWLSNGLKLEVVETENEILDILWRLTQRH